MGFYFEGFSHFLVLLSLKFPFNISLVLKDMPVCALVVSLMVKEFYRA